MKMIQQTEDNSRIDGAASVQFAIWDVCKMLAAAVLGGLAISVSAAGITLLLSRGAEAHGLPRVATSMPASQTIAKPDDQDPSEDGEMDLSPTPGAILLGDGCDYQFLSATERDWQVRIDGKRIDVRVMQTFQLPAEGMELATFHVQLIKGARIQNFAAQTSTRDWAGQVISAAQYEQLTPAQYLSLSRDRILASHSRHGTVVTSPFIGLKPRELLTIEYAYVMTLDSEGGMAGFSLLLDQEEGASANRFPETKGDDGTHSHGKDGGKSTRGAVWVNWTGNRPSRVLGLPTEAALKLAASRVEGFSWETAEIQPGARLQLAWAP